MRISVITAVTAGLVASTAFAQEVAPTAVSYNEGAVEQSLSGVAGDPANGRLIVGDKGQGNCVACHEVSDLADVPFHGEIGPMLDGAGERWSEAELRGIVANAKMMFEDSLMPSFYKVDGFTRPGNAYTGKAPDDSFGPLLSAQQIEDVVAYLATLKE
ncbi:sulfur oxidation c-type cytochrome SoxX [Sulfitobacter donghicola]|uniref:Monoheme cytochrome C SoxX n=1 Tax=Sulfitobacter donghicola DSW-25 = KCTC 12864 = JCM 14565 TaxID=1300350 RepID=A0A073IJ63_9RHOB|nr:sulfur oxidation c-type cytochrome SoxX [Sulfitobacter donghicola]KEJ89521.1 monoheme cytochrome C SoxX [Sulfitobacter donghicola DSW-25 = KCTC 12864 = JCM 14565]KIN69344.1 Monoheme cytochrome c SoxX [Sulfitobacter donghicola DSW-25 = KCTC 12864 = JCM 14565]